MPGFATPTGKDALADWAEFTVLFQDQSLSRSSLRDYVDEDSTHDDLEEYDLDGGVDLDTDVVSDEDVLVDEVFEELRFRKEIAGEGYPFMIDGFKFETAVGNWRDTAGFALMSCLNARHLFGLKADTLTGSRLFERLVAHAMESFWCGDSVHFGWPRHDEDLATFEAATRDLARAMGERVIFDLGEFPSTLKDAGLDAVTWRTLDARKGTTVLLLQCAIGDDWDSKGVIVELWRKFLSFSVPPMTGLAFPFVPESVRSKVNWEILCGKVGVPLDRIRLTALLGDRQVPDDLRTTTIEYIENALAS